MLLKFDLHTGTAFLYGIDKRPQRVVDNYDSSLYSLRFLPSKIEFSKKVFCLTPIYCSISQDKIIISENIRDFDLKITDNYEIIESYLRYGFVSPPYTLYSNIYKISSFSKLCINIENHDFDFIWEFPLLQDASSSFRLLDKHLSPQKDDYYSLLFSGGVDSSILACKYRKHIKSTFSLGFEFEEIDLIEKKYAFSAAKELSIKTKYRTYQLENIIFELPALIYVIGEPIRSIQSMLLYCLFRDEYKKMEDLILNGQGADAIFGNEYSCMLQMCESNALMRELYNNISSVVCEDYLSYKWLNLVTLSELTLTQWARLSSIFGKKMLFPFYNKELIKSYFKVPIGNNNSTQKEKALLKDYGTTLLIPEYILNRKKASFGPISTSWDKYLRPIVAVSKIEDTCYTLWNNLNIEICNLLFCRKYSVKKVQQLIMNKFNEN